MPSDPRYLWPGRLTDGRSARSIDVDVSLAREGLRIASRHSDAAPAIWLYDGLASNVPLRSNISEVVLSSRSMPGATLLVVGENFPEELGRIAPHLTLRASRLEGLKPGLTVGALVFSAVAAVYAFDLSPSKGIASLMPAKARDTLGESVLNSLPSRTACQAEPGRTALRALVQRLAPDEPKASERVIVLDWNVVNAFAVPGGRVVLTRGILQRAANADEIAGVLAHEIGHGVELHPEAGLVRSVGFWALVQMVFTGTPGALGNAGTMLAQLAYSRTAEREADDYALAMLKRAGVSPKPFAALFRRLEGNREPTPSPRGRLPASDLFSSHPATPERIAKIEGQSPYPSTPALTDQQWQDLRQICGPPLVVPPPTPPAGSAPDAPVTADNAAEYEKQIAAATARINAQPTDGFAYRARALIHARQNKLAEAIADLDRAIELAPRNAGYRADRGNLHLRQRDYRKAEADYSESIRLNPQAPLPLASRGVVYRLEKRYDAALSDFNGALAINPLFDYAQLNRGLLRRDQEHWADAVADFTAVIERNANHLSAYAYRGQVYEKLDARDKAIADYRKALSMPGTTNADLARTRLLALGQVP